MRNGGWGMKQTVEWLLIEGAELVLAEDEVVSLWNGHKQGEGFYFRWGSGRSFEDKWVKSGSLKTIEPQPTHFMRQARPPCEEQCNLPVDADTMIHLQAFIKTITRKERHRAFYRDLRYCRISFRRALLPLVDFTCKAFVVISTLAAVGLVINLLWNFLWNFLWYVMSGGKYGTTGF